MIPLLKLWTVLIVIIQIMCQTFRECRAVDFVIILPYLYLSNHNQSNPSFESIGFPERLFLRENFINLVFQLGVDSSPLVLFLSDLQYR